MTSSSRHHRNVLQTLIAVGVSLGVQGGCQSDDTKAERKGQAAVDADLLNGAVDAKPGKDALPAIEEATARLAAINESVADGDKMTAAQGDYIETFLNDVGADNLAKLPEVVRNNVPSGMPTYAANSVINGYLSPVSDAILNYSNPAAHRDDAGIDFAGYQGSTFTPGDGRITLSEMPQAIQDLTAMRLGYDKGPGDRLGVEPGEYTGTVGRSGQEVTYETIGQDQFSDIANYDKYSGYADLMSSASDDVEGGSDFSTALGDQAIQAKQNLKAISEDASDTTVGHERSASARGQGPAT